MRHNLASTKKHNHMSFTKEQEIELNNLSNQYSRIFQISGVNPDKFMNEFSFKFMDTGELNRNQLDSLNLERTKTFINKLKGSESAF